MKFTRYLYNTDEVLLTLLEALLKQKSVEECYFWVYEYYESGFHNETWDFIWKVYYDFYAIGFPKFEKKIKTMYNKWKKTNDFMFVTHVVRNLHKCSNNIDYRVFLSRIYYSKYLIRIFKNPTETESFNKLKTLCSTKYEELLLRSLCENCVASIAYYLNKTINSPNLITILESKLERKIKTHDLYDKFPQIMVQIVGYNDDSKWYFHKENKKKLEIVKETDKNYRHVGKHKDISYVYKTLPNVRLFGISDSIGCFRLERQKYNLKNMFWYNWEYFAYKSPIWKKRFDKCDIEIDHEQHKIVFKNIEQEEEFYEKYGFEPDEQSREVQEKSTKDISKTKLSKWIKDIFKIKLNRDITKKLVY